MTKSLFRLWNLVVPCKYIERLLQTPLWTQAESAGVAKSVNGHRSVQNSSKRIYWYLQTLKRYYDMIYPGWAEAFSSLHPHRRGICSEVDPHADSRIKDEDSHLWS